MVTSPNFLAAQVWGTRPKCRARRIRALRSLLGRTIIYFLFVVAASLVYCHFSDDVDGFYVFLWWVGVLICNFSPFWVGNRFADARTLQANHHDYYLTGMSGREILTGFAAPYLAGCKLFAWTFILIAIGLFSLTYQDDFGVADMSVSFILSMITTLINLFVGTRFALALWAKHPARSHRAFMTAAFIFSSPMTLLITFPPLIACFYWVRDIGVLYFFEFVTLPIRLSVFSYVWQSALDHLDVKPKESDEIPNGS